MDALELVAKLKMDISEYEKGLDKAKGEAEGFGGKLLNGLGKVGKAVGKATLVAVGAAATGVAAITKQAVAAYADYEQLIGGVETLYEDLSYDVEQNAAKAFETAGLSANEYMETAMSFAASLNQSLMATEGNISRSADLTDQAVIDMADNANKMGSSMESIQNAYQGFAKQNYTMLDNLKLGYGGTKSEMERLVTDAEALDSSFKAQRDANGDLALSFADIVEAIHIVQDDLGITGTTAKEASTTIQGSLAMTKSAWENLLVGLADKDADLNALIDDLISSATTFAGNIIPIIEQVLVGVGKAIETIVPKIMDEVPNLINNVLPKLLESGKSMIEAILTGLSENMDTIIDGALDIVTTLVDALVEILPMVVEVGLQLLLGLAQGIAEALPELIPTIVDVVLQIVQILLENLPLILDAGLQIIMALVEGLLNALPNILAALPAIMKAITTWFIQSTPMIVTTGIQLLTALVEALPTIIDGICSAIPAIITACIEAFTSPSSIASFAEAGNTLFTALIKLAPQITATIITLVPQIITGLINAFIAAGPQMAEAGKNLMRGLGNGLSSMVGELSTKVKGIGSTIVSAAKSALGIHSPSTVFAEIGENTMLGYEEGVEQEALNARQAIEKSLDFGDMETSINANLAAGVSTSSGGSVAGSNGTAGGASFGKGDTFIIPVYIGQTLFAEAVVDGQTLENYRSGGR